ncbi:MAG: hypothetical protein ABSH53_11260 [Holophaga sp.]|jgi:hypothetical protein
MRSRFALSALLVLVLARPGLALDPDSRFKLSGYGTLGLAWNSTGQAAFLRDLSQPDGATRHPDGRVDSRLGVQGDATLTDTLRVTAQVISRYRFDRTFTPQLPYLVWSRMSSSHPGLPYLDGLAASPDPSDQALAQGAAQADLKLQVDRVHSRTPSSLWNDPQPGWNGNATVVAVTVDFVF